MNNNHLMLAGLLGVIVGQLRPAIGDDGQFQVQSNLRAGVAKVDITPSDVREFEVTGHRRKVTGVPAKNVMVAASHNHSGPSFSKNADWGRGLIDKLGNAAKDAAASMRPVSVGYGEDQITFGIKHPKEVKRREETEKAPKPTRSSQ